MITLTPDCNLADLVKAVAALERNERVQYCGRYVYGEIKLENGEFSVEVFRNGNFNRKLREISLNYLIDEIRTHFGNE